MKLSTEADQKESIRDLRRTSKSRELNGNKLKTDVRVDDKPNESSKPGNFEYLRDPAILKSLNLDPPASAPVNVDFKINNINDAVKTQQTVMDVAQPIQESLPEVLLRNLYNQNIDITADAPSTLKPSIKFAPPNDVDFESDTNNLKPKDSNNYTATGITKRVSYDVIELPRKPRRLQKKSMEYVKAKTIVKSLNKPSNLARRSRELMQHLKLDRLKQPTGSRPIPQEFVNKHC